MTNRLPTLLAALALLPALAGPGAAQYDRDGRYVPSPMGVPQDPYARPVPLYPGTPGGAVGTPIVPRGAIPKPPAVEAPRPPPSSPPVSSRLPVPLIYERCQDGWSRATGLTRKEFTRRCEILRRQREDD